MAKPAGEELDEVALRGATDAELEGLDLVDLSVWTTEAEQEASHIQHLHFLRVLEFGPVDAELVFDVEAGGNVCARWCEGSDIEAVGGGLF